MFDYTNAKKTLLIKPPITVKEGGAERDKNHIKAMEFAENINYDPSRS